MTTSTIRLYACSILIVFPLVTSAKPASRTPVTRGRAGFVSTSGGRLYFETAGRGPAIVFIHGGQMDRRMWDHQFTAYAKRYKAIRYDVRGFGRTGLPTKGYSDVEDLLGLLNHLKVNRVSIVGLSLGGRIALDFVLAHPDRVESLVLADPGLSGWNWSADQSTLGEARFRAARDEGTKKSAEMWLADPYMVPAMEKPAISKRIREIVMANASGELANPFLNRDLDLRSIDHLAEIHAPSLILIGDRDVPDIQKIVDTLAAGIKGSRKEVIKDSGHITNMEQPEQFDRFVLEFIDRLHSGGSAAGV